ncbi:BCCT family transporter [Ferrimonas marina]|uniref:Choline-glycine betaine transporter n=1 Tax=Ferrimonas marina TaxID=299255 RepID=A0A1M5Z5J7_9GAMM|nr:BCCT family transporter [Ferrimonas marina]SHI19378.1 Choline-glycine betaine transporter [Ferrimonas marina]
MSLSTGASADVEETLINPNHWAQQIDIPVLLLSGGGVLLFALAALLDIDLVSGLVNQGFGFATRYFGAYWQLLMLATFFIGLTIAMGRNGRARMGNLEKPEISTFKWTSVIMCTLLAGGGVFWAAAEPMAHFVSPPPLFADEVGTERAGYNALAQSFMHWGFLAWAILGCLTSIVFSYLHYQKGLPLKPRTLLYPLFGQRIMTGWAGALVDASCVLAVVAGTVGPIGFLALQVGFGLESLFGISNGYDSQMLILVGLVTLYTASAITGVTRGIQLLSRFNIVLAAVLMLYLLLLGPTAFIVDGYIQGMGTYLDRFVAMATFREDQAWLGWWTVFFWGWFLGYGPLMAMFVARISRGRTLRQMILMISVVAPVITCFWFTIVGGSGIAFELANPGVISEPFSGMNLPAALLAITGELPMGLLISVLFLVLTTIFVATTGDSMTYTISMVMTGTDHPHTAVRVFWAVMMGVLAAILLSIGEGGVGALQSFIVVAAVPVSLILLPSLWNAPSLAKTMAEEQGIVPSGSSAQASAS